VVRRRWRWALVACGLAGALYLAGAPLLSALGRNLVVNDAPAAADAIVVLASGVDVYPRLAHAARLYREGLAPVVVINGDRRNAAFRELQAHGFRRPCPWDAEARAILAFLGVPDGSIVSISAPDAFDSLSEAEAVVPQLRARGLRRIIVTTSDYHSRRARAVWRARASDLDPLMSAAADGQFQPESWWRDARQVRWVLAEYGGWLAQYWKL
jgi:uncharacterized SAM-binding protein YcdF (DUF218 family)